MEKYLQPKILSGNEAEQDGQIKPSSDNCPLPEQEHQINSYAHKKAPS